MQVEGGKGELQHRPAGLGGQPLAAAAGVEEPPHVPLAVRPAGHLDAARADHPACRLVLEGEVQVGPLRVEGQVPGGGDEVLRLCLRVGLPAQVLRVSGLGLAVEIFRQVLVAHPAQDQPFRLDADLGHGAGGCQSKREGKNRCGSAASRKRICWRGVSSIPSGGCMRRADQAIWETQYLKSRQRRSWGALQAAVPWVMASVKRVTEPAGARGRMTHSESS